MHSDLEEYFGGKTILITGSAGFIGSCLLKRLSMSNCKIICQYHKTKPMIPDGVKADFHFYSSDLKEDSFWTAEVEEVDVIFHLAAQTSINIAANNPIKDIQENIYPIVRLIEETRSKAKKPDVIMTGTATQVGITLNLPINGQEKDNPETIYDINKLASEYYLIQYSKYYGGRGVFLRLANVYGPGTVTQKKDRAILNKMIEKVLNDEKITLYGTGQYIRDYIYVEDVIDAIIASYININNLTGNSFVIGTGVGTSIGQMAEIVNATVESLTGKRVPVEKISWPNTPNAIELRNFIADSSLFSSITKWNPMWQLENGIKSIIETLIKQG